MPRTLTNPYGNNTLPSTGAVTPHSTQPTPSVAPNALRAGAPGAQSSQTIFVDHPGGTIGYSTAQWDPVKDASGNVVGVQPKSQQGGPPVTDQATLQSQFDSGQISQFQYDSSLAQLNKGAPGVDPSGFAGTSRISQIQDRLSQLNEPFTRGAMETPEQAAARQASLAEERAALTQEASTIQGNQKTASASPVTSTPKAPTVATNTGSVTKTSGITSSKDLVAKVDARRQARMGGSTAPGTIPATAGTENAPGTLSGTPGAPGPKVAGFAETQTSQGTSPEGSAPTSSPSQSFAMAGVPAELQPLIAPILQNISSQKEDAASIFDQTVDNIASEKKNADYFADQGQALILQSTNRQLNTQAKIGDLSRAYAEEANRKSLAENTSAQALYDVQAAHAEFQQRQTNIDTERQNSLFAAKTGANFDSSGIDWMERQHQVGQEALTNITMQAAVGDKQFADQRIGLIKGFALDMRNIDLSQQQEYDKIYDSYNSTIGDITKNKIVAAEGRTKAFTDAAQKYYDTMHEAYKQTGDLYGKLVETVNTNHQALLRQENDNTKWKADYTFKVQDAVNQMAFNQEKFQTESALKVQELTQQGDQIALQNFEKQGTMRDAAIATARNALHDDRYISSFETTYKPNYDNFMSNYAQKPNAAQKQAMTDAYSQLTKAALSSDPSGLGGAIASYLSSNPTKSGANLSPDDMKEAVEKVYTSARQRKFDAQEAVLHPLQKTNLRFTDDIFKLSPEDVGIKTPPLQQEVLDAIKSWPPGYGAKISTFTLGKKEVTTNREMQVRLEEADRMYFEDSGKHLNIAEGYRSPESQAAAYAKYQAGTGGRAAPAGQSMHQSGSAVDINPDQWEEALPYLIKAGLKQLPATLDQQDAGHFSLNGK